ncbi:hypothetical protein FHR92_003104 [Fontibacillus solani]|uniref:Uncharacterized protein n=1 Tax=Fontibacillus solani TaxID=1572857 RepID=A0A7W3SV06_9BACL|nr:hypothetical protein [Fontibacillus solani]
MLRDVFFYKKLVRILTVRTLTIMMIMLLRILTIWVREKL